MQPPPPIPSSPSHTFDEFVRSTAQQDKGHGFFEKETERLLEVNLNGRVNTKMGSMVGSLRKLENFLNLSARVAR